MPRRSAAAAAATARSVLDAAAGLFAADGYGAVSLDDVARAAGVTRGAVYHHYGSKRGLFVAVATHLQQAVAEAVRVAAAGESDPGRQLTFGSHAFLDAITDAPAARVLLVDGPAVLGWAQWRTLDAKHSGALLREGLEGIGVAGDLLEPTAAQLSGAMNEAALWVMEQEDPPRARELALRALDRLLDAAMA